MDSIAVRANPAPYSKRTHTFRTTAGDTPAARARLGTVPFGHDARHAACRETGLTSVNKFSTGRIERVRVQTKIFGDATTQSCEVEGAGALDSGPGTPASLCFTVDIATVIPDEIDRPRLSAKCAAGRAGCVLDAISVGANHFAHSTSAQRAAPPPRPEGRVCGAGKEDDH
jgi:hypothetical protein